VSLGVRRNNTDAAVNPAATEICNQTDDDCDGLTDGQDDSLQDPPTWYTDGDGDGYGDADDSMPACDKPYGRVADATDCDDGDAAINPGATEVCNSVDDDCDGLIDGQDDSLADGTTWYQDSDGDGYGDPTVSDHSCSAPSGYVADGTDCDDGDSAVSPGAAEVCNSADDDCDGLTDDDDSDVGDPETWYPDADADGYGDTSGSPLVQCAEPSGHVPSGDSDCDDGDAAVNPGATEVCNSVDDDCDGLTDDQDGSLSDGTDWCQDADGDGYGDASVTDHSCSQPSAYVEDCSDCDDGDATLTTDCGDYADDGSICSSLMGSDDGLVPTWTGDCDAGSGFQQYGDHCYYAVSTQIDWADARASCVAAGGYLATIGDSGEDAFIQGLNNRPYLGGCDADTEGTWTWVTGEVWSYTAWGSGEPNDNGGEDCLEKYSSSSAVWNDIWCTGNGWNQGYICEFEGVASDTGDTG